MKELEEKDVKGLRRRVFAVNQAVQGSGRIQSSKLDCSTNFEGKYYHHPRRDAITSCEHCGKPICAECRAKFRGNSILGYPDEEFCSQCNDYKTRMARTYDLFMYGFILFGLIGLIVRSLLFGFP